jgi:hypothetical protein
MMNDCAVRRACRYLPIPIKEVFLLPQPLMLARFGASSPVLFGTDQEGIYYLTIVEEVIKRALL